MFKKAVLIIHGFMGDVSEVEYLSNYIKLNSNLDTYTFTLPGHDKHTLKNVKYQDWIDSSEKMLEKLKEKYNTIYVVGHSMGGVIATILASKNKCINKIVLVAPAFIYLNFNENLDNIKNIIKNPIKNKERYSEATLKVMNTSILSMLEFRKMVEKNYDIPKQINCSTLIIQGEKDAVVPIKSSNYVYDSILSRDKHIKTIPNETHAILYGKKKEEISNYITAYLKGGLEWITVKNSKI